MSPTAKLTRERSIDRRRSVCRQKGQVLVLAVIGVLVLVLLALAIQRFLNTKPDDGPTDQRHTFLEEQADISTVQVSAAAGTVRSIAVPPFVNRSEDEESSSLLSDGIHSDLLGNLSKIQQLEVTTLTPEMTERDKPAILLSGTVQQAGDRVLIHMRLINANAEETLWAESWELEITAENLFDVQEKIIRSIAGALEVETTFEKDPLPGTGNAQAFYAYGVTLQNIGRPRDALSLLLRATELEPRSVDALFALGTAYDILEEPEAARDAFARIRKIDPSSPLGYLPNSGTYLSTGQLDEATFWLGKGLAVNPGDFELGGWILLLNDCLEDYETAQEWSDWLGIRVTKQAQPMAMQARHYYLTGNFETAVQYANLALNLNLPDRWGSDSIFMRIKRDEALASGDPEAGLDVFRAHHPGLFNAHPEISAGNVQQAVDLALLLDMSGRSRETKTLLNAVLEFYGRPWSTSGSMRSWLVPARSEALAILGDERGALAELRRIIDRGWRIYWRWETDMNPNFNGIRKHEEFLAMVDELEADMANQRARTQAMADRNEITAPPEFGPKNSD